MKSICCVRALEIARAVLSIFTAGNEISLAHVVKCGVVGPTDSACNEGEKKF